MSHVLGSPSAPTVGYSLSAAPNHPAQEHAASLLVRAGLSNPQAAPASPTPAQRPWSPLPACHLLPLRAEKSVHCEIDRETKVGQVKCNLCHAQYAVPINELSEPIDVYRWDGVGCRVWAHPPQWDSRFCGASCAVNACMLRGEGTSSVAERA